MSTPNRKTLGNSASEEELATLLEEYLSRAKKKRDTRALVQALQRRTRYKNVERIAQVTKALLSGKDDRTVIEATIAALRSHSERQEG